MLLQPLQHDRVGVPQALDCAERGAPGGLEPLEQPRPHQAGQCLFVCGLAGTLSQIGRGPVPGHGQCVDGGNDLPHDARIGHVQLVAPLEQHRVGEFYRRTIGEMVVRVVAFQEGTIAAHRDGVNQWEQDILRESLRVVGAGIEEETAKAPDTQWGVGEGAVVAAEQQHEAVEVPEGVVDRRGGEQHQVFRGASHEPVHGRIPRGVVVPKGVGLVHDDEAVHVLVDVQDPLGALTPGGKLPVVAELLVRDHLTGKVRLIKAPLPQPIAQLGRRDDERVESLLPRVLGDELQADFGLARAHPVRIDHAAVALDDAPCPLVAILLEPCQPRARTRWLHIVLELVAVQLQQRAEEDGLRIGLRKGRQKEVEQFLIELLGVVPEPLEPAERHPDDVGLVVNYPELEVGGQARPREVG